MKEKIGFLCYFGLGQSSDGLENNSRNPSVEKGAIANTNVPNMPHRLTRSHTKLWSHYLTLNNMKEIEVDVSAEDIPFSSAFGQNWLKQKADREPFPTTLIDDQMKMEKVKQYENNCTASPSSNWKKSLELIAKRCEHKAFAITSLPHGNSPLHSKKFEHITQRGLKLKRLQQSTIQNNNMKCLHPRFKSQSPH